VWLYFADRHRMQLLEGELAMYMQWSAADPPDAFEFTRNARIVETQGNGNPFIEAFGE
jgi:endonuclease I